MDLSLQITRSADVLFDADNTGNINENSDEASDLQHDLLGNNLTNTRKHWMPSVKLGLK